MNPERGLSCEENYGVSTRKERSVETCGSRVNESIEMLVGLFISTQISTHIYWHVSDKRSIVDFVIHVDRLKNLVRYKSI